MSDEQSDSMPLVSASIITYNRKDMVTAAIDSALAQDYPNMEVVICDDGSSDGTGEVIKERYGDRVTYIYQENQGPVAARNTTLQHTSGKYIALNSDDDVWLPEKISRQVAAMEAYPEAGLCYGKCLLMTPEGEITDQAYALSDKGRSGDCFGLFLQKNVIMEPAVMLRSSTLDEVGHFDPELRGGKDTDMFLRVTLNYPAAYVPEAVLAVREHSGRRTKNPTGRKRALHARALTMAKLLRTLPPEREEFRPTLARRLVWARLDTLRLVPEELSWDDLVGELRSVWQDVAWEPAAHELAQGTISTLGDWGRAHPDEAGERLSEEGLVKLIEKLAVCVEGGRPAPRAARLYTALGLDRLKRRQLGGTSWIWHGLWRNCGASIGQSWWAATRWMRAD